MSAPDVFDLLAYCIDNYYVGNVIADNVERSTGGIRIEIDIVGTVLFINTSQVVDKD